MARQPAQLKGRKLKGIKKRPKLLGPQTAADQLFCERWLIHFDKDRAWREAGFSINNSGAGHNALAKIEKFADYLRPIRDAKAKIMAERLSVDAEKIVRGMSEKVFFDPTSFYERSDKPLTEWVTVKGQKEKVEQLRLWDGKPIYGERLKPYSDLTPAQQSVVEITSAAGEVIHYRLPNIREQHTYFTSLGRQLGMFAEKLIVEKYNHKTVTHALTFENVPTQKLQHLTRQLLPLVGLEFAQQLGYTAEDIEAAQRDEGVVVEVPTKSPA